MLINKDSRAWIVTCIVLLVIASFAYYAMPGWGHRRLNGPSGGSWEGIVLGVVGTLMMLFALLLGLRKKVRTMRIGRAYMWLQGHVWLGLVSYPIILYHAGFRWGGPLTQVLMWLFTLVIITGIYGLVIQQIFPTKLLREVSMETIYEQISRIVGQLRSEAQAIVTVLDEHLEEEAPYEVDAIPAGGVATAVVPQRSTSVSARQVKEFYTAHVAGFLQDSIPPGNDLKDAATAGNMFAQLRDAMPAGLRKTVETLRDICDERRQLARQRKLHHWLHGWLLIHVPASYCMFVVIAVHIVKALQYTTIGS